MQRQGRRAKARPTRLNRISRESLTGLVAQNPTVALVLQGGGALGAYQCGVYERLHEAGIAPTG